MREVEGSEWLKIRLLFLFYGIYYRVNMKDIPQNISLRTRETHKNSEQHYEDKKRDRGI